MRLKPMTDVYTIFVENRSADRFQLSREVDENKRPARARSNAIFANAASLRRNFHVRANRLNSHLLQVTVKMLPGRRRNWCSWKLWRRDACRHRIFWIDFVQPLIIRMQNYERRLWSCWRQRWTSEWQCVCLKWITFTKKRWIFF